MFQQNFNRTKVVATIGPATESYEMLEKIIEAGVDVCRLNCSHGSHDILIKVIERVRAINEKHNLHTCLLADLQGPKIRLGEVVNNAIEWTKGDIVTFTTTKQIGTKEKVYITYPDFAKDVTVGESILVDDGKFELTILETNKIDEVTARVLNGGKISSKKGVNLPKTKISLPSLTEKDLIDLDFALENNVEWVALSFVRTPNDILELKERIKAAGKTTKVVAKIEKPEAVECFDEILKVTDAVMVARGDLGVELPMEEVPLIQKMLVKKCIAASKPVIIATQMMESMISSPKPTRAESNDVANAVLDGADAVMLSAETSVGLYPVEVIEQMERIIHRVEQDKIIYKIKPHLDYQSKTFISDSVCLNAVLMSKEVKANAIISMTKTGYTAFKITSFRPESPVFIFSDNKELLNTINLIWGVRGLYYDEFKSTDSTILDVIAILKEEGHLNTGDVVVNTASMPIHAKTRTNALKISIVE
jgi:pyruvate kinase